MSRGRVEVAGRASERVTLQPQDLNELLMNVRGPLLRPGDEGWDAAVRVWNGMVHKTPALVLQPLSAAEVASAVAFARDRGLLLSVKGGGHNIAGTSLADGGLTLDMSRMCEVRVDPQAGRADVGPGCRLGDVDGATQAYGLATPLGFVSETGVAGLTLGGGFGYLTRRFGWTVDNLEEVEIVTSEGEVRLVNVAENPDLFWAVRGGGGNFGVVTRFAFRLHEVGPTIIGGLMLWSAERADEVLRVYRDLTASAPRELTASASIRQAPPAPFVPQQWHGKKVVGIVVCHSGARPEDDLRPLRSLGGAIADSIGERPYVAQQSMLNAMEPPGMHRYWKAEYLADMPDDFLGAFRESALQLTSPLSNSIIFHLAGALNERPDDDGAVGNRDARYIAGFSGTWPPAESPSLHVAWVRQAWESIRPFSTGGNYVNFQQADDDEGRTRAAYGDNYARLERLKAKYDPANVFRVNRNISPNPVT